MEQIDTDDEEFGDCIQACLDTYSMCTQTKALCIATGGKHAQAGHLNKLTDCAVLCQATADLILRGSPSFGDLCRIVAPICEECAANCESFSDEFMKSCAQQCRECAQICLELGESIVIEGDVSSLGLDGGTIDSVDTVDDEPLL